MSFHHHNQPQTAKKLVALLACSLSVANMGIAFADPGAVNSVNITDRPTAGQYYNTGDQRTVFSNPNGGMSVSGNFRFLEVGDAASKTLTGNGGSALFQARFVGLDGARLDASAVMQAGKYVGNGGHIEIKADTLYSKNSDIIVSGLNGGSFTTSVGSYFAKNTNIDARGTEGAGGKIQINSAGAVDVDAGSLFDASGKVIGNFDSNLINITGAVVNVDGILRADGLGVSNGGNIKLVATGTDRDCVDCDTNFAFESGYLSAADTKAIRAKNDDLMDNHNGDVLIGKDAVVSANGGNYANGGNISVSAKQNISNSGKVLAIGGDNLSGVGFNGGNGGFVSFVAQNKVTNTATGLVDVSGGNGGNKSYHLEASDGYGTTKSIDFTAGGAGGNGGAVVVSADSAENAGQINANGGNAGNGSAALGWAKDQQWVNNASAISTANGAAGQKGGNGGLIVFDTSVDPVAGKISMKGGNGGNGGDASAYAYADSQYGDAIADARAVAGNGGAGGNGGTLVVKNPGSVDASKINAAGGTGGRQGYADAEAKANGYNHADSYALAQGLSTRPAQNDAARAYSNAWYNPAASNANAQWLPGQAGANGANGNIDALRPSEVIVHNGNTVLLNGGGSFVRSTSQQLGGATVDTAGTHTVIVSDRTGQAINLQNLNPTYTGARDIMINTKGDLTNSHDINNANLRNVWMLSDGKVVNNGNIATMDSVTLSAQNGLINEAGKTISSGSNRGGGSLIVQNREGFVDNKGALLAEGANYGGSARIISPGVINRDNARISANAYPMFNTGAGDNAVGGFVHVKGDVIDNSGKISADQVGQYPGYGLGGENRLTATDAIFNRATGYVTADAQNRGGSVSMSAEAIDGGVGVGNQSPNGFAVLFGDYPNSTNPIGTALPTNKPGVIVNEGYVSSISRDANGTDGSLVMVGDNGVLLTDNSYLNRETVHTNGDFQQLISDLQVKGAQILIAAGPGAKQRIICLVPPPPPNNPPNNPPGQDLGQLFRNREAFDTTSSIGAPTAIAVSNGQLFLAKAFEGITQSVLDNAYAVYQSSLAQGMSPEMANQRAIEYLMQSGMTCDAAAELANRLQNGAFNLANPVEEEKMTDLLTVIGGTCQPAPCNPQSPSKSLIQ